MVSMEASLYRNKHKQKRFVFYVRRVIVFRMSVGCMLGILVGRLNTVSWVPMQRRNTTIRGKNMKKKNWTDLMPSLCRSAAIEGKIFFKCTLFASQHIFLLLFFSGQQWIATTPIVLLRKTVIFCSHFDGTQWTTNSRKRVFCCKNTILFLSTYTLHRPRIFSAALYSVMVASIPLRLKDSTFILNTMHQFFFLCTVVFLLCHFRLFLKIFHVKISKAVFFSFCCYLLSFRS